MPLPALALFLRGAVSAAARSGAMGRGVGGIARTGRTLGEFGKARAEYAQEFSKGLGPTQDLAKKQQAAAGALDNFKTSLGVNTPEIVKSIKEWRDNLVEGGKALATYNGTIATAYQRLAIGDQQRRLKLAQSTAGSGGALADSENRRRDAFTPWTAISTNIQNRIGTVLNTATSNVGEFIKPLGDKLDQLLQVEEAKNNGIIVGLEPLREMANRSAANRGSRFSK